MKYIACLFSAFLLSSVLTGQVKPSGADNLGRIEKIINSQWTFNYFPNESADKGYEAAGFDDSRWAAISLPHTWMTYETTGDLHPFIMNPSESENPYWWTGWGWYRKHFSIKGDNTDRKIFIEFEGVQKYCKIWINGTYLGDHKGGYGSFDFDLTKYIRPGEDNVLAVAVNNRQNDIFRTPPMVPEEFNVYGGIYRDVTIVLKNKLYIPMQGSALHEGGTFVTTPHVTEQEGIVRVMTWVQNDYSQQKKCILRTTILDGSGKIVLKMQKETTINPGRVFVFDQSGTIKKPSLWSPQSPSMYNVISELIAGDAVLDNYKSPLGFRWFRWNQNDNSLYINGKKQIIHGGSRQQDFPWLGDAVPKWLTMMDLTDIAKNMNFNFLRTSQYPNDRLVYDLADKYGIVTDEVSPSIRNQNYSPEVQEQQMREMIRRDRNHPSVMFWSMGDLTDHAVDSKYAIAEDTTRIIMAPKVSNGSAGDFISLTDKNLNMENHLFGSVRGWYNNNGEDVKPTDGNQCGTEELQQKMMKESGLFGKGNLFAGVYQDHGADCEILNSPIFNVSSLGLVDSYRIPKYGYYFWQASYSDKAMIFIQPHFWRSQYFGQKKDIIVNSNCDRVELKVNGISKGFLFPSDTNFHSVTFKNITVEDAVLTVEGNRKGESVSANVAMANEPARIVLTSSHTEISADRGAVAVITADIQDSRGNHVYGASNSIKWTVSGPGKFVGPTVYDSDTNNHHESDGVWYIDMPVSNVIRSTGTTGKISVKASSGGLISGRLEIEAIDAQPDNTIISEPVLNDAGRRPVTKIMLKSERLNATDREIKPVRADFSANSSGSNEMAGVLKDYIIKNNPSADSSSIEFKTLISVLTRYLKNNNGHLSADDFNFNINNFNNCRQITGFLSSVKLPPVFTDGLKRYYAEEIIRKSNDKDAGDEMNWLNWIPAGGTVVISQAESKTIAARGTVITNKHDLADIITVVHPSFANFSAEGKERAISFISKMNPYVKTHTISEKESSNENNITTVVSFSVETGQPILIPLMKFIAE